MNIVQLSASTLVLAVLFPLNVEAQTAEKPPVVTIDVGAGVAAFPRYQGARSMRVVPVPVLAVNYKDIVELSPLSGLRVNVIRTPLFTAGPIVQADIGRTQEDTTRYLTGLSKINSTVELGGFVDLTPIPDLTLSTTVKQGLSGHGGFVATAALDYSVKIGERSSFSLGPNVRYTDGRYNRAYFGVTPAQAAASRFVAYRPGAGITNVGVQASLQMPVANRVRLLAFGGYDRLTGPAARSPIVRDSQGRRDQVSGGLAITYRFNIR